MDVGGWLWWALSLQIFLMVVVDGSECHCHVCVVNGIFLTPCFHSESTADSFCREKGGKNPSDSTANVSASLYRQILQTCTLFIPVFIMTITFFLHDKKLTY